MNPSESEIEEAFYWQMIKHIQPGLHLVQQHEVNTQWGTFRLDFFCQGKLKVAFECDGKDYHEAYRDELRDSLILGEGHCDVIYHIRGADIVHLMPEVLYLVSKWNPEIISERGKTILARKASRQVVEAEFDERDETFFRDVSFNEDGKRHVVCLEVTRRTKFIPQGRRAFWPNLHRYACDNVGISLDELIEQRRNLPVPQL